MGELYAIIQRHLDRYGVREAALARRMDTSSQTINSWKTRGVKQVPTRKLLEALARETTTPYDTVLRAALIDAGYLDPITPDSDGESRDVVRTDQEPVGGPQPEPHSTTVTAADIAAGATLPLAEPRHRRNSRSSGTTPRRHTT